MLVYQDLLTGDELLSDSFPYKEIENGILWEVEGKWVTLGAVDVNIGANPSAEEGGEDEGVDDSVQKVVDIVDTFRLQEQPTYDKKGFIAYIKKYIKLLTPKLNEEQQAVFKKGIEGATKFLLPRLGDFQFFVGEGMHDDSSLVFAYYKEGATNPTFLYFAHGLKEVKEAEMMSLKKQQEIEELQAQLGEAEDIVGELRVELYKAPYLLEKLANDCQTNEEKKPDEAFSLEVREDSTNHEGLSVTNGLKPDTNDRVIGINRCSYKESKEPCLFTLPSILSRRREAQVIERNGDCADVMEVLTEAKKEEEKGNDIELSTTAVSPSEKPCIRFKYTRKRKKDGRSYCSSPEGEGSSSQDDEKSRKKRQNTCEKDNVYLDSFNSTKHHLVIVNV